MNIPNKINIGGLNYNVSIVDFLKSGMDAYGECWTLDLDIRILKNIPEERQKFAFIHEILHAVYDNMGLGGESEEHIHKLGAAIYQVITDNPHIFLENKDK